LEYHKTTNLPSNLSSLVGRRSAVALALLFVAVSVLGSDFIASFPLSDSDINIMSIILTSFLVALWLNETQASFRFSERSAFNLRCWDT